MAALSRTAADDLRRSGLRTFLWILAIACTLIGPTIAGASSSSPTAASQELVCFGSPPTIVGTEGPDQVRGTPGDDVIVTLGGVDTVDGTPGGADKICTGDGGDTVLAGAGNDQIDSGAESDTVLGGQGDDNLVGGEGLDLLAHITNPVGVRVSLAAGTATGAGTDRLSGFEWVLGSAFGDVLEGDERQNVFIPDVRSLFPAGSDDVIDGAGGFDFVLFEGSVRANLATGQATGEGNDRLTGIEGIFAGLASTLVGDARTNFLQGGGEDDVIDGAGGDDTLVGRAGNDRLSGGAGFDLIVGGSGNDAIDGGAGIGDIGSYLDSPKRVQVSLASGRGRGDGADTLARLETIVGSQLGDTLEGSGRADRLHGKGGNDRIRGGAGDDFLDGGGARDQLGGGPDLDYCYDGEGNSGCEASERSRVSARSARQPTQHRAAPGLAGMRDVLYALASGKRVRAARSAGVSGSPLGLAATGNADDYVYDPYPMCLRRGGGRSVATLSPPRQIDLKGRPGEHAVRWQASLKDAKGGVVFRTAFAQAVIEEGNEGYVYEWLDLNRRKYQLKPITLTGPAARRWEAEVRIEGAPTSSHQLVPPCPFGVRR